VYIHRQKEKEQVLVIFPQLKILFYGDHKFLLLFLKKGSEECLDMRDALGSDSEERKE